MKLIIICLLSSLILVNGADLLGGILGTGDASNLLNNLGGVGNIAGLGTGDLGLSNILSGLNPTTSLNPNGALDLVQHSVGVIGGLSNPDSASGSIANLLSGVDKLIDPVEGVLTKLPVVGPIVEGLLGGVEDKVPVLVNVVDSSLDNLIGHGLISGLNIVDWTPTEAFVAANGKVTVTVADVRAVAVQVNASVNALVIPNGINTLLPVQNLDFLKVNIKGIIDSLSNLQSAVPTDLLFIRLTLVLENILIAIIAAFLETIASSGIAIPNLRSLVAVDGVLLIGAYLNSALQALVVLKIILDVPSADLKVSTRLATNLAFITNAVTNIMIGGHISAELALRTIPNMSNALMAQLSAKIQSIQMNLPAIETMVELASQTALAVNFTNLSDILQILINFIVKLKVNHIAKAN